MGQQRRDGVGPRAIQARFRALQVILAGRRGASAVRDGHIRSNPCAGVTAAVEVVTRTVEVKRTVVKEVSVPTAPS